MIARRIFLNWLAVGAGLGAAASLQVLLATEDASLSAAIFLFGVFVGLCGGIGRILLEHSRGGLSLSSPSSSSSGRWTAGRMAISTTLALLVVAAGAIRALDGPLPLYVGFLLAAASIAVLRMIMRRS